MTRDVNKDSTPGLRPRTNKLRYIFIHSVYVPVTHTYLSCTTVLFAKYTIYTAIIRTVVTTTTQRYVTNILSKLNSAERVQSYSKY